MTDSPSDETSVPEKQDKRLFWVQFVAASITATFVVALLMYPSGNGGCSGEILWLLALVLLSAGVPLGVFRIAMSPSGLQGWSLATGIVLILAWALFEFFVLFITLHVVIVCI